MFLSYEEKRKVAVLADKCVRNLLYAMKVDRFVWNLLLKM